MNVRSVFGIFFLSIVFLISGPGAIAGMHGSDKSSGHMEMTGSKSSEGHMMEKSHGEGMEKHGSTGERLFSGEAFGTNISGSMVDVKAKMGKGMTTPSGVTHHFMLTPEKTLGEGTVGKVVITYPGGEEKEVELAAMGNHIGTDLNLDQEGLYGFTCTVTRGPESKTFEFAYEVK